jgi:hypothetical protein
MKVYKQYVQNIHHMCCLTHSFNASHILALKPLLSSHVLLLQVMARVVSHGPDGRMNSCAVNSEIAAPVQSSLICPINSALCCVLLLLQVMARVVSHGLDGRRTRVP